MPRHRLRIPWRRHHGVTPTLAVEHVGPLTTDDIAEVRQVVADAARTLAASDRPDAASPETPGTGAGQRVA